MIMWWEKVHKYILFIEKLETKVLIKTVCAQISVSEDFAPQIIETFKSNIVDDETYRVGKKYVYPGPF